MMRASVSMGGKMDESKVTREATAREAQMAAIHKAVYAGLTNPETRKSIEASGTVIAEPMSLAQLDSFYKKEATTGAAIAKSINLLAQ